MYNPLLKIEMPLNGLEKGVVAVSRAMILLLLKPVVACYLPSTLMVHGSVLTQSVMEWNVPGRIAYAPLVSFPNGAEEMGDDMLCIYQLYQSSHNKVATR